MLTDEEKLGGDLRVRARGHGLLDLGVMGEQHVNR